MAQLDPLADQVVREAVDAFVDGRLVPDFAGETVFETRNSRYRAMDGVLFAAPDASLVGAELIGWLIDSNRRSAVESAWQPGARAVLVDRNRGRHIIVTSATRVLHLDVDDTPTDPGEPVFAEPEVPFELSRPSRTAPPPVVTANAEPFLLVRPIDRSVPPRIGS